MANLICPKCGSTDVYCGGMNPVQCNAVCHCCGFSVNGANRIARYFGGHASYSAYLAEKEAERREQEERRRASEEFSRQRAEKQAHCHHEWHTRIQSGVGCHYCPKCGAERP